MKRKGKKNALLNAYKASTSARMKRTSRKGAKRGRKRTRKG